ncbi:MAG: CCA tRNA nucleotidyltransferase [Bacillota bacterium]|nr:CCA tRNA nucleotidyltransferase [Bacillota bacterium]
MKKLMECREKEILDVLGKAGYEAYFVGGCIRDAVMGRDGGDVDVATNALPEQIIDVFSSYRVIETGIKHGTVTVLVDDIPVEVTTYRSDGTYSDGRHPDSVEFVKSLEEDLARRDFTVNAIACDAEGNLTDPFGGAEDIEAGIIRTVGDPEKRFREDGLRIMRGLRFAAVLGFEIEEETALAMARNKGLLKEISVERIFVEFKKLLAGEHAGNVLRKYVDVLSDVLPEIVAMKGFEQHNPYHKYDVLEHCIRAMEAVVTTAENATEMKMVALLHDVGKPDTYFMDDEGIGHFYGHPKKSEELVRGILQRLKADKATLERVTTLVRYHDLIFDKDERLLKRWMNRLGPEVLMEILEIKLADNIGTGNMSPELGRKFADIRDMMADILAQEQCFSLKDLAVGGNDIIALGVQPGPEVGRILAELLEAVIEGECENEKEALLARAKHLC